MKPEPQISVERPVTWVALTGFMGVGKTRIGRELARELMLHFVDLDRWIERATGLTIPDIFRYLGEETFRKLEREAVRELVGMDYLVISLGGGTFVDPQSRPLLLERGPVVALWASPETIHQRVSRRPGRRPLLEGENALEQIKRLLKEREDLYRLAPIHVESEGRRPRETAQEIVRKLWRWREARGK